ncbi:hypothetical protein HN873_033576 [Arachis hypogaea]
MLVDYLVNFMKVNKDSRFHKLRQYFLLIVLFMFMILIPYLFTNSTRQVHFSLSVNDFGQ